MHGERPAPEAVTFAPDRLVEPQLWGRLEWMVSGAIGNSEVLTVGKCFIDPGQQNPRHVHPNCDEVLHVVSGSIRHLLGDEYVAMSTGDTISIPTGVTHHAVNTGEEAAELLIVFSTAYREVVGE